MRILGPHFRLLIISLIVILSQFSYVPVSKSDQNQIYFKWAMGTIRQADKAYEFQAVSKDTTLKSGDHLKFYLHLESKIYVYLLHVSSMNDITMLYPPKSEKTDSTGYIPGEHFIPTGDHWFELDNNTGKEIFYLLASANRLTKLEKLIKQDTAAITSSNSESNKMILDEIRYLRKSNMKFKTSAEKPVSMIGDSRAGFDSKDTATDELPKYAMEVSTEKFYSKAITIDHR